MAGQTCLDLLLAKQGVFIKIKNAFSSERLGFSLWSVRENVNELWKRR